MVQNLQFHSKAGCEQLVWIWFHSESSVLLEKHSSCQLASIFSRAKICSEKARKRSLLTFERVKSVYIASAGV